jgi:opine dehydrogenase
VLRHLGRLAGVRLPLHEAGVAVFSALYGEDMASANDLLDDIVSGSPEHFHDLCRHGFERISDNR